MTVCNRFSLIYVSPLGFNSLFYSLHNAERTVGDQNLIYAQSIVGHFGDEFFRAVICTHTGQLGESRGCRSRAKS